MIDNENLKRVLKKAVSKEEEKNKIGLLSEKTLHSTLKYYFADEKYHEKKIGNYYVDILIDNKIYEVQTANFNKLREKLNFLLRDYDITIIYPVIHKKIIFWVEESTNEITNGRLSNKKGNYINIFPELYKIKQYLNNNNLHLKLVLINVDEYKSLNGWDKTKKKGSSRIERVPTEIVDILDIKSIKDYSFFTSSFNDNLFTSKDFKSLNKCSTKEANLALNILLFLGIVERVGKQKRLFLYKNKMEE